MKLSFHKNNCILTVILLLFVSCQYRIIVKHSIDSNGNLNLFFESKSIFLKEISIHDLSIKNIESNDFVWIIYAKDNKAINLDKVVYGILPNGFIENKKPFKLIYGKRYLILVHGPGVHGSLDLIYKY